MIEPNMDEHEIKLVDAVIRKLKENEEMVILEKEEIRALREWLEIFRKLKGVIWLAGLFGSTLKWFAGIVAIWFAFQAGLFEWIKKGIG